MAIKSNPFLKKAVTPEVDSAVKELELKVVTNQYLATVLATAYFAGEQATGGDAAKKGQLKEFIALATENLEGAPKPEQIVSFRYIPGNDAPAAFVGKDQLVVKYPIVADLLTIYIDKAEAVKKQG